MIGWVIGVIGVIIVLIAIIKIATRNRNKDNHEDEGDFWAEARNRVKKIGNCCKKIKGLFGRRR